MSRRSVLVFCVCGMLFLAGCDTSSMKDALQLTVGGEPATGAIQAEDIQWYKAKLDASKRYAFIFKTDQARVDVGVIFSVYLVEEDVQTLMWQRHYCPDEFVQLTNENAGCCDDSYVPYTTNENSDTYGSYSGCSPCSKQLAVDDFLAPKTGEYYISIEGYVNTEGKDQANSYAYTDTLVYSVAVKYADTPFNPQGADLPVNPQAAAVPYVTNLIEVYETVYHRVSLQQYKMYQVQSRRSDIVTGPVWLDQYGNELSSEMYFVAPYTGTFLIKMVGPGGTFGYAEYGLRVQQDDHKLPPTKVSIGSTVQGYLGEADTDFFIVTVPEKPSTQPLPDKYRVTITPADKFVLSGLTPEVGPDGIVPGSYIIQQEFYGFEQAFSPVTQPSYAWLNNEPDGAGAYTISIAVIPAS